MIKIPAKTGTHDILDKFSYFPYKFFVIKKFEKLNFKVYIEFKKIIFLKKYEFFFLIKHADINMEDPTECPASLDSELKENCCAKLRTKTLKFTTCCEFPTMVQK